MPRPPPLPAAPHRPFRPVPPLVIGLVGGVAAGKSTVAAAFAAHGLRVIDADRIARRVTAGPSVLTELLREFGEGIQCADGSLDRAALAATVFADPARRQRLEAITHPPIRRAILAELAAARAEGASVLLDAPLLLEGGLIAQCQVVVFVAADEATRRQRAAARGWPPGELERREAAQAPLADKLAAADFVIANDGTLDAVRARVDDLLRRLAGPGTSPPQASPPGPAPR